MSELFSVQLLVLLAGFYHQKCDNIVINVVATFRADKLENSPSLVNDAECTWPSALYKDIRKGLLRNPENFLRITFKKSLCPSQETMNSTKFRVNS